ncbi:MAG: hypothetical protein LBT56_01870 [Prevotellaceae bacterium]|nr:hypothetical protein [Prevotellaceae bacterium]
MKCYSPERQIFRTSTAFQAVGYIIIFPQATLSLTCSYENIAFQAKPANNLFCKNISPQKKF